MKIFVLGGDGYCGWATALYLSARGHRVVIADNFARRQWDCELGVQTLTPIRTIPERLRTWSELSGQTIQFLVGDIADYEFVSSAIQTVEPDAVVHFAEQRSAPYSMIDRKHAVFTQVNNVLGTLNLLFALREFRPDCHLVKLGTMGEYGTPNIDIEEGYITIEHNGRKDVLPFPKQPGSFYHLSKVHDSHNILFACRIWGLRATDLNQGVVYGTMTDEVALDEALINRFDYDEVFGTVLNRFCVQAAVGLSADGVRQGRADARLPGHSRYRPLRRAGLPEPAASGRMPRVQPVHRAVLGAGTGAHGADGRGQKLELKVEIDHLPDPRVEAEEHYYNARHSKLTDLGLKPHLLSESLLDSLMNIAIRYRDRDRPIAVPAAGQLAQRPQCARGEDHGDGKRLVRRRL